MISTDCALRVTTFRTSENLGALAAFCPKLAGFMRKNLGAKGTGIMLTVKGATRQVSVPYAKPTPLQLASSITSY